MGESFRVRNRIKFYLPTSDLCLSRYKSRAVLFQSNEGSSCVLLRVNELQVNEEKL